MVSIAIHGMPVRKAERLREKIFNLVRNKSYAGMIGITVYPSRGDTKKNPNKNPHFEVSGTYRFHSEEILRILRTLKIEIIFS